MTLQALIRVTLMRNLAIAILLLSGYISFGGDVTPQDHGPCYLGPDTVTYCPAQVEGQR